MSNMMVILVELLVNLPIAQNPSLWCMNIHTTLWLEIMSQSKGNCLDEGSSKLNEHMTNNLFMFHIGGKMIH